MTKVIIAYIPVLHDGYRKFFEKHSDAKLIFIFGEDLMSRFSQLRKEKRALASDYVKHSLRGWPNFPQVIEISSKLIGTFLAFLKRNDFNIVMPDDDVCREFAKTYLEGLHSEFDASVFLRWDRTKVLEKREVVADEIISRLEFDKDVMRLAYSASLKATNLWRQVGAALVKEGSVLLVGFNKQLPSQYTPYFEGDPRGLFKQGVNIDLTTDGHAEALLIAEAAKRGLRTEGADIFITTFPCPPCAKLVAKAGIKRCFFVEGYAMLDGERILKDFKVEIIRVEI